MEENSSQSNKYDAALAKYNTNLSDADIQARVADLIEKKVPENNTEEVKKLLFNCIDLTTLNSTDSDESVMHFTEKVNEFDNEFPDMKNVAAICVYPNFADIVKNTLQVDGINIACVSGGFPSSQTFIEVKVAETALAIADGADEIDIVISIGKFLSGQPMIDLDHLFFDEGQRGITAAEAEGPDLDKGPEKLKQDHAALPPFPVFLSWAITLMAPTTPQARMTNTTFRLVNRATTNAAHMTMIQRASLVLTTPLAMV